MLRRVQDRGIATVELALVLPILLVLVIGIIDLGIAVNVYVTVTNGSREGAHYAISHPTAAPSAITAAVYARTVPLDADRLTVTTTYYDGATFRPWPLGGLPASSPAVTEIPVRVEVSYPWSASTILIGAFFTGAGALLHGASTMAAHW